ncbi:hypothetical protein C2E23DRAFT_847394, partial [Lenzites betulinus]
MKRSITSPWRPFDTIPNEIMAEIFKYYDHGSWNCCAQVLEWLDFAMSRARHRPVKMQVEFVEFDEHTRRAILPALAAHRTRINDVMVIAGIRNSIKDRRIRRAFAKVDHEQVQEFLRSGMPALEDLQVVYMDNATGVPSLVLSLDPAQLPRLRRLDIELYLLPWAPQMFAFAGLRDLSLDSCRGTTVIALSAFLDVLETVAPQLEWLNLIWSLPLTVFRMQIPTDERRIEMPNLRGFTLYDDAEPAEAVLRCLCLPRTVSATVVVNPLQWNHWEDELTGMMGVAFSTDNEHLPFLATAVAAEISLLVPNPHEKKTEGWVKVKCTDEQGGSLNLHIACEHEKVRCPHWLRNIHDFATFFGRSPLERLTIKCDLVYVDSDQWTHLFRTFDRLRALSIESSGFPFRLLAALQLPSATEGPILPRLDSLTLDVQWRGDLLDSIAKTLETRCSRMGDPEPKMKALHIRCRHRQKNSYLNRVHRQNFAKLVKYAISVTYKDI